MQWVDFLPPILGTIWPSLRSVFRYLTGSKPRLSCCYSDHQAFLWDSAIPGEGERTGTVVFVGSRVQTSFPLDGRKA